MAELTHLDAEGDARMVDVSAKAPTVRTAVAESIVEMDDQVAAALFGGDLPKGDALAVIRIAAIQAAKRTPDLIPLCHPLPIDAVDVDVERVDAGARIAVTVTTTARTGVEMEAMTAASVAALTLYDMTKARCRAAVIDGLRLLHKSGGKTGTYDRAAAR